MSLPPRLSHLEHLLHSKPSLTDTGADEIIKTLDIQDSTGSDNTYQTRAGSLPPDIVTDNLYVGDDSSHITDDPTQVIDV
jgi:hypothetical protein